MGWTKKSLIRSIAWVCFIVVVSFIGLWFISTHPSREFDLSDAERSRKWGFVMGSLLSSGLILLWLKGFIDSRKEVPSENNKFVNYLVVRYANKLAWVWLVAVISILSCILWCGYPAGKFFKKNSITLTDQGMLVENVKPSLSFIIPKGFVQIPAERVMPPYLYVFTEENCREDLRRACLTISFSSVGGIIDPNKPVNENEYRASMTRGIRISLPNANPVITFEWIPVFNFKMPMHLVRGLKRGQNPITSLGIELPLKYDAVALILVGPAGQEEKMRSVFNEIIFSLKGDAV